MTTSCNIMLYFFTGALFFFCVCNDVVLLEPFYGVSDTKLKTKETCWNGKALNFIDKEKGL